MMVSNLTPGSNQIYTQVYNPATGMLENRLTPAAKRRRRASRMRRKIREAREEQRAQDLEEIRQTSRAVQGKTPLRSDFSVVDPIPKTGSAFIFFMVFVMLVSTGIVLYEISKS